ncbi:MAG: SDR family oxidoreductase [Nitrospinota bacterium]|nr:SDR family oxidoreductase [Nitrospinota bacterium]
MSEKWILFLGAGSDVARELAKLYAIEGYNLYLAGRDVSEMEELSYALSRAYGIKGRGAGFDALDYDSHARFYSSLEPKPYGVVCAFGYLGVQERAESEWDEAKKILDTNLTGAVSILNIAANDLESRKSGFIIGISSTGGDRGRATNYIYGAAKGGFSSYLSGLRNRLYRHGVSVLTVKPGFMATKMTAHLGLPKLLTASPASAAGDIFRAARKGKNIVYTKWFWGIIMFVIIHIPEGIFKRMKI